MGIAETEKKVLLDSTDLKSTKARCRVFLKRRSIQLAYCQPQSHYNLCTGRRRLRRLLACNNHKIKSSAPRPNLKQQNWSFFWCTLLTILLVLCFSCCIAMYQHTDTVSKFMQKYSSQYQAIVHNKLNYCDRNIPLQDIFERIHSNVLNQEVALNQLELALANRSSFHSIALVGTSGVGKSLTMRLLQEQYPWSENIQSIAWNDYELADEKARYQKVLSILHNLAHCGRNLFIIDNMAVCDLEYVSSINALVHTSTDVATGNKDLDKKQLTIIFVFNLNGMLPEEHYRQQLSVLQELQATTVINYRSFKPSDLEQCARHEAKLVGVNLQEHYIDEMVNTTNVKVSGCKTVRAKVLIYGQAMLHDQEEYSKTEEPQVVK